MAIWLVRAGKKGEYESKFLEGKRVYLTWDFLADNLTTIDTKEEMQARLASLYPDAKHKTLIAWRSQIWPFVHEMQIGDWVVLPSKYKPVVHVGRIAGGYIHVPKGPNPFYHYRAVEWLKIDLPRDEKHFDPAIIYSFGSALTICRVQKNNAEAHINALAANEWKPLPPGKKSSINIHITGGENGDNPPEDVDINYLAETQISQFLTSKFKGHAMANLIDAIFRAKGYETYVSPPGPDGGVDILAGPQPFGFGQPRLCIQIKTGAPADTKAVSELEGVVKQFSAEHGILISWQGFKQSVEKLRPQRFFSIRLWGQREIIRELLQHYDQLEEEMRALIPLKRIWVLTSVEGE